MKPISIYQALSELDIVMDGDVMKVFDVEFVRTTGNLVGTIARKTVWRKDKPLQYKVFKEAQKVEWDRGVVQGVMSKFKGNNKVDQTLPVYDFENDQHLKFKIWSLLALDGRMCLRPKIINGQHVYPRLEGGKFVYE